MIDNEAARLGLVKGYSPVWPSLDIIAECLKLDYFMESSSWFARVPTVANIADTPSRMEHIDLSVFVGASCVRPIFPAGFSFDSVLE